MKFDQPSGPTPADAGRVLGRPTNRVDGRAKVTGTAPYAYERHDAAASPAYGVIVGSPVATGRIRRIDLADAERAPGVLGIVTYQNAGPLKKAERNVAPLLAGPNIAHYDQAVAVVIAETFEQARSAAKLVRVDYSRGRGAFDLQAEKGRAVKPATSGFAGEADTAVGDFAGAFADAPVKVDATYTTPDQSHMMMEPHATMAAWDSGSVTLWTSNQMIDWGRSDMAETLGIPRDRVRLVSPFIGGGFGGKLWLRADALLAALGSRAIGGRAVKVALARPQIANNTVHRPATIQRIRLGADRDGRIRAIAHENWSGDQPGGGAEYGALQTRLLYRGEHRLTRHRLATLNLPEGNAMRAPGEAPGLMALEVAMDELAEACSLDPVELRIRNDIQHDPEKGPARPFSQRRLVECLRTGAERFGWSRRNPRPRQVRDGRWLVGMGVASAIRGAPYMASAARVTLGGDGRVLVETDMTDIGTGTYTILAQTAAEMLGVPIDRVEVRLGDSAFPVSAGSGGQWGANSSASGVYAACMALRRKVAERAGFDPDRAEFADGRVRLGNDSKRLADVAGGSPIVAEDKMEWGEISKRIEQSTFGAHFVEVGVDEMTAEVRVRRLSGVFSAGRIYNPKAARSQVIGGQVMGVGAALMEELVVDPRFGFFVNHDMAEYQVPVHADIPDQDILFLDGDDPTASPLKGKGVGELGICGVAAAVANAVYNATGKRVREYPITLDKLI